MVVPQAEKRDVTWAVQKVDEMVDRLVCLWDFPMVVSSVY